MKTAAPPRRGTPSAIAPPNYVKLPPFKESIIGDFFQYCGSSMLTAVTQSRHSAWIHPKIFYTIISKISPRAIPKSNRRVVNRGRERTYAAIFSLDIPGNLGIVGEIGQIGSRFSPANLQSISQRLGDRPTDHLYYRASACRQIDFAAATGSASSQDQAARSGESGLLLA